MVSTVLSFALIVSAQAQPAPEPTAQPGQIAPIWKDVRPLYHARQAPCPDAFLGRPLIVAGGIPEAQRARLGQVPAHRLIWTAEATPEAWQNATTKTAGAFWMGIAGGELPTLYGRAAEDPFVLVHDARGFVRHVGDRIDDDVVKLATSLAKERHPNRLVGQRFVSLDTIDWLGEPKQRAFGFADHDLTLVRWWTRDCPFCEASLPDLAALTDRHDVALVPLYHEKNTRKPLDGDGIRAAAHRRGIMPEHHLGADPDWKMLKQAMAAAGLKGVTSVSFLVDTRGVVRWVHAGPRLHESEEYPEAARSFAELRGVLRGRARPAKQNPGARRPDKTSGTGGGRKD